MLLMEPRNVIEHIDRGDIWIIETADRPLRLIGIEGVLRKRNGAATAKRAEHLAGVVDRLAEGVRHSGGHTVPVLDIEAALQAVVDGKTCICPLENFAMVAINILRTGGSSRS